MERLKALSFKFTDSDAEGLRLVAEHMAATGRLLRPEKTDAIRLLIRDYVLRHCPVGSTLREVPDQQAA